MIEHRRDMYPCTSFYHISARHTIVNVSPDKVSVKYIYYNSTVIDEFDVFKNGTISFIDIEDCFN